jgi:hypothetical protein
MSLAKRGNRLFGAPDTRRRCNQSPTDQGSPQKQEFPSISALSSVQKSGAAASWFPSCFAGSGAAITTLRQ